MRSQNEFLKIISIMSTFIAMVNHCMTWVLLKVKCNICNTIICSKSGWMGSTIGTSLGYCGEVDLYDCIKDVTLMEVTL